MSTGEKIKALVGRICILKGYDASAQSSDLEKFILGVLEKESGRFYGKDGYTPVKGVDYYTEAEKAELLEELGEGPAIFISAARDGTVTSSVDFNTAWGYDPDELQNAIQFADDGNYLKNNCSVSFVSKYEYGSDKYILFRVKQGWVDTEYNLEEELWVWKSDGSFNRTLTAGVPKATENGAIPYWAGLGWVAKIPTGYAVKSPNGTVHTISVTDEGLLTPGGAKGDDGNGIASVVLNDDYTLTLNFTDGTNYTTASIRGADGEPGKAGNDGADGYSVFFSGYDVELTNAGGNYHFDFSNLNLTDNGRDIRVGDFFITASGGLCMVNRIEDTYLTATYLCSLKGTAGKDGDDGADGNSLFYYADDDSATYNVGKTYTLQEELLEHGTRTIQLHDLVLTKTGYLFELTAVTDNLVGNCLSVFATGGSGSGVGIESMEQIVQTNEPGDTNIIKCTLTDGTFEYFGIRNGYSGYSVFYSSYVNANPGYYETVGNTYKFDVSSFPIDLHGSTLRVGDMVLTSDGIIYKVTTITDTYYNLYCAVNMRVKDLTSLEQTVTSTESGGTNVIRAMFSDNTWENFYVRNGRDGLSTFLYDDDVEHSYTIGNTYGLEAAKFVLNDRTLQNGDFLISNSEYLFQVTNAVETSDGYYSAKCMRFIGTVDGLSIHYYDDSVAHSFTIGGVYTLSIESDRPFLENDLVISSSGYLFKVTKNDTVAAMCICVAKLFADIPNDDEVDTLTAEIV